MADPESILQLGIEAARDGNRDEARNLFRMLTRQEPNNAQAWLWLAGVAENREERQGALERVVELDPTNEMALKGLQALGVRPGAARPAPPPEPEPAPPPPPARSAPPDDDPFGDDPFAELDALSDVMADAAPPPRRSDPPPSDDVDIDAALAAANVDGGMGSRSTSSSSSRSTSSSSRVGGSSSRSTSSSSRGSTAATARNPRAGYGDDETEPARRGLSPLMMLLLGLLGVVLLGLIIFMAWPRFFGGGQQTAGAGARTATARTAATQQAQIAPTSEVLGGGSTTEPTAPLSPTMTLEQPTAAPDAPTAAPAAVDLSQANPQVVAANTPLNSAGWRYDFNQPTYAAPIIGPLGSFTPANGRFVVVLVFAINETGQPQPIPGNFFVIKDAQGRVWEARPEVSTAYVQPGVNADLAHNQDLPPNGITHSVAIIFDVAPDATDLVFFARSNPGQGWLVLRSV